MGNRCGEEVSMTSDAGERGPERLICMALTDSLCDPGAARRMMKCVPFWA
jgi:hypothetical protein